MKRILRAAGTIFPYSLLLLYELYIFESDSEEIPDILEIPSETVQRQYRTGNQHGYYAAMSSLRLLRYLSRMLQNRIDDQKIKAGSRIDRKLYQKIQDKKHAQGLK